MKGLLLIVLLSFLRISQQKSTTEDDHYVAAVVEFHLSQTINVTENLISYVKIIKQAADKNADIIVFPEKTLTDFFYSVKVPINGLLKKYPVPALQPTKYDYILVTLSKAARENEIYVVVNLQELLDCRRPQKGELCLEKRTYYYSVNIAFDRTGALFHRSRKNYLFGEPFRTADPSPEFGSFKTDFGVTFLDLINADLLFRRTPSELVERKDVSNIVFTTAWYSELPFWSSVETQRAVSGGWDVNLLAACANTWEIDGSGGSGIYSGRAGGALISIIKKVDTYHLLVAEVPKIPGKLRKRYPGPLKVHPAQLDDLIILTDATLDSYLTIPLKSGYQDLSLDYQDINCKFKVNVSLCEGKQCYRYRAIAFSGVRKVVIDGQVGARACGVIACTGDDVYTCGMRFSKYSKSSIARFSELTVVGTVPKPIIDPETKNLDSSFFPHSLTTSLTSLQPNEFDYNVEEQGLKSINTISLNNLKKELYAFGFYGRKFTDDGNPLSVPLSGNIVRKLSMDKYKMWKLIPK